MSAYVCRCLILKCDRFLCRIIVSEAVPVLGTSMPEDVARASGSSKKGSQNVSVVVVGCSVP